MGLKAFAIVWLYVHLGIFLITHFVRKCLDSYKVVDIFTGSFLQNHVCKDLTQVIQLLLRLSNKIFVSL